MSIVDLNYIKHNITTNAGVPLEYRWTHGATEEHLGDGLLVYSIIQMMRAKVCVCIGSGSGFIPRIMTQARIDLYNQNIFQGNGDYNWGDIGATYLVDACNGIGGPNDLDNEESFFRKNFYPRFIKSTSVDAYYNFFVKQDIQIDFLFIDGDHSYEGVKTDFELYSSLLSDRGIIAIHDTDKEYEKALIISEDAKKDYHPFTGPSTFIEELGPEWRLFNFFNEGILKNKPSSTGLTLIQHA
jgi:hypothetical protein